MVWIFCPEMTLAQFPKSKFWNFCWIFCPEMTLAQIPEFGFFVQNSRIGVKFKFCTLTLLIVAAMVFEISNLQDPFLFSAFQV